MAFILPILNNFSANPSLNNLQLRPFSSAYVLIYVQIEMRLK